MHPVLEALSAGRHIERVLIRREGGGEPLRAIRQAAQHAHVPVVRVPMEKLDRLVRGEHQGVAAYVSPLPEQDLDEVISGVYARGVAPFLLVLDGVTDVRNVGAIARSAECLGAHAMVIPTSGSARLGPDAVKSSSGALLRVPVCRIRSLAHALHRLHDHGLQIVALTEKGAEDLPGIDLSGPLCLVLGGEEQGISDAVLRLADHLARIPMSGKLGSLNVSVAAGIALYAAAVQRR
ncbi:MAG: 23S rRNA (guanosine(2251)-2'-O)-methyltransferase RlmB [Flavobacteriales bacterium]|nr:23S rRNA (guanosine(2251)-2'-O)-methyltransferase RlmB [Flavobacteriales bacterium]MCB9165997.1 23S rRNA (guanosine(2251)-2'-O)-methyltransferase RlmB [Flavobacteriales bacterium]